jgi:hypothetical protein
MPIAALPLAAILPYDAPAPISTEIHEATIAELERSAR